MWTLGTNVFQRCMLGTWLLYYCLSLCFLVFFPWKKILLLAKSSLSLKPDTRIPVFPRMHLSYPRNRPCVDWLDWRHYRKVSVCVYSQTFSGLLSPSLFCIFLEREGRRWFNPSILMIKAVILCEESVCVCVYFHVGSCNPNRELYI